MCSFCLDPQLFIIIFRCLFRSFFFFFNDTATTEIYTLSLHDALPISPPWSHRSRSGGLCSPARPSPAFCRCGPAGDRSEEHTSELQSLTNLVCRLLLEKKNSRYLLVHRARPPRYQIVHAQ